MIFELIKTSVGLVSKSTADGVAEWAKDIVEQSKTEITLLEAVDIILNLASKTNDAWIDTGLGFKYLEFDTTYDYFPSQNNNAYFFSNYSQTNYKEDRATLFEDIMTRAYKRPC